ncbi:hypothetical protein ABZ863_27995 [Saccharomonospora sp. NPDC046836]|uniref:hypothetical protein n=1 Tax=Saccharomonospora sp. NPDC046836 TaxID=3156921 RepID=UPI0033EC4748
MSTTSHPGTPGGGAPELGDAATRLVALLRLRNPRVHLVFLIVLSVLVAVCLAATITRFSAWPLLPLAPFGLAALGAWRARTSAGERQLLGWVTFYAVTVAIGFWVASAIGRILS